MKINQKDKKAAKAGLWYTVIDFITKGAIFLTTPFFTRLMTPEQIGTYSNITAWNQVLFPIVTFSMYDSLKVARFKYADEFDRYTSSILVYGSAITAAVYVVVMLNMEFFSEFFAMAPLSIHLVFLYMMTQPAVRAYQLRNHIEYRYKRSALIAISNLVLSLSMGMLLTVLSENKVAGRAIGHYGVHITIAILLYVSLLRSGKGVSSKYFKYAVTISFPMIWHVLSMHLLSSSDRIIIRHYIGESATALYSIAYTCSHVVSVIYHALNTAWSPWAMVQMKEENYGKLRAASRWYVLLFFGVVICMLLICPELLMIMGGKKYMEAIYVMPPAMLGVVSQFVYALYVDAEYYLMKQSRIAIGTIFAASLNVILNIIFIPRFGYVAAAYTTMIGYFTLLIFHYLSVRALGKTHWFDTKFNFLIVGMSFLLIFVANFLYAHTVLRYAIVVAAACAAVFFGVKYKQKVIEMVKLVLSSRRNRGAKKA